MKRLWKRDRSLSELEDELRAQRRDPPEAFLRAMAKRVRGDKRSPRASFRLSPAYGVALIAVVALAAAGGSGLVQSATSGASHLVAQLTSSSSPVTTVTNSPGNSQYSHRCGTVPPHGSKCVISITNTSLQEPKKGCTPAGFTVNLSSKSDETVTVQYLAQDGTASTLDGDYLPNGGTLTFVPGQTSQTVNVQVCKDALPSPPRDETFSVNLSNQSFTNATIASPGYGTGLIKN